MKKEIHQSFRNISAKHSYKTDTIILELERIRNSYMVALDRDVVRLIKAAEEDVPLLGGAYQSLYNKAIEHQNAVVVAKSLLEKGETELVLNPEQELTHQVLAMADIKEVNYLFKPDEYQAKLQR
jgi:hypothetical protein